MSTPATVTVPEKTPAMPVIVAFAVLTMTSLGKPSEVRTVTAKLWTPAWGVHVTRSTSPLQVTRSASSNRIAACLGPLQRPPQAQDVLAPAARHEQTSFWGVFVSPHPPLRASQTTRYIGAPRFELGTSPTRTVRATRLRHAPMQGAVSHKCPRRYLRSMPAPLIDIIAELNRLLEPQRFEDYCLNGLQVPGPVNVERVATGVSANLALLELAAKQRADLVLVHHGLFWGSGIRAIDEQLARRLKLLFENGIALAAYHLPLDAHPEVGNNALIAQALGAGDLEPFGLHGGEHIGVLATLPGDRQAASDLFGAVERLMNRVPLVIDAGPERIMRLAIVSGSGSDHLAEAAAAGADALLTGEPAERATADARELGVHLIAAGHHATETLGVQRLGEHLVERFAIEHVFIDVPNPI
jgi:dinuclear metal center YbgI/SA1388 family protein